MDFEEGEEEVQLDVPELGDVVVQEDGGGVLNGQQVSDSADGSSVALCTRALIMHTEEQRCGPGGGPQ
jgi:hypothetical protein